MVKCVMILIYEVWLNDSMTQNNCKVAENDFWGRSMRIELSKRCDETCVLYKCSSKSVLRAKATSCEDLNSLKEDSLNKGTFCSSEAIVQGTAFVGPAHQRYQICDARGPGYTSSCHQKLVASSIQYWFQRHDR